jgi:hypothetical protein
VSLIELINSEPEGKILLGRPRYRWKDIIRMGLKRNRVGGCGLDTSGVEKGPLAGPCEHGNEHSDSKK